MYKVGDLKVGMIVRIRDLKDIYDTVIILTDVEGETCKEHRGRIIYIGEPDTKELRDAISSITTNQCTVYNLREEEDGLYE